jgi:hypothetical protein
VPNPNHRRGETVIVDQEHDRPWESPGAVRRDCEPHRAGVLNPLGVAACVLGILSGFALLTAPIAIVLGAIIHFLARRDLASIRAGLTDPNGAPTLRTASVLGVGAVVASAPALLVVAVMVAAETGLVGNDKAIAAWACGAVWALASSVFALDVASRTERRRP